MARKAAHAADDDELFAAPPSAFVGVRNRLAARLRQDGRGDEAAEVSRRRRPSAPLWLVNALAREDRDGVRRLLETVDRLRKAHLRDARAIPEALRDHRAAVDAIMQRAGRVLAAAGLPASPATLRRAHATLAAAAADPGRHAALRLGRLTEELEPVGFEAFEGMPLRHLTLVKPAPDRARAEAERREKRAEQRTTAAERRRAKREEAAAARRRRTLERATRQAARLRERLREVEDRIARERRGDEKA